MTKHLFLFVLLQCLSVGCATDNGSDSTDAAAPDSSGSGGHAGKDGSTGSDSSTGGNSGVGVDADADADACPGYDLKSYTGSTDGLCPPEENTGCFCFELTQGGGTECDPGGAGCVVIPSNCERCGWLDCTVYTPECAAVYSESYVKGGNKNGVFVPCVSDATCSGGLSGPLCNVRIGNRMFCSPP